MSDHGDMPAMDNMSPKASKFRFKSKSKSKREKDRKRERSRSSERRRSDTDPDGLRRDKDRSRRREKDGRHKRSRTTKRSTDHGSGFKRDGTYEDPDHRYRESLYDGLEDNHGYADDAADMWGRPLSPDAAFRESLFDALADDEGAEYWQHVYGQPIHTYPNTKVGPQGELEKMTDEEYAEYVRQKMWEKSHQHIIEEREAYEKARKERKEREKRQAEDQAKFDAERAEREAFQKKIEESLRFGEERKRSKEMKAAWEIYAARWEELKNTKVSEQSADDVRKLIPWPVLSGKQRHVSKEEIEQFMKASPHWKDGKVALLKAERVRWHPDKMQQRFGQHIDDKTMKSVTAVFQVVDKLWNDHRGRA